jgi:hypothetical protein
MTPQPNRTLIGVTSVWGLFRQIERIGSVSALPQSATELVRHSERRKGPIASHARAMALSLPTEIGAIVANGIRKTPEEKFTRRTWDKYREAALRSRKAKHQQTGNPSPMERL